MANLHNYEKNHNSENNRDQKCSVKNLESCYLRLRESKVCLAVIFTLLGISISILFQVLTPDKESVYTRKQVRNLQIWSDSFEKTMEEHRKLLTSMDQDPFDENSEGIFAEMNEMQKRMNEIFANQHKQMAKIFLDGSRKKNIKSENSSVMTKQDDNFYYYELSFSGFDKDKVLVSMKNGFLTFAANKDGEFKDKKSESKNASSFRYSFSIPAYNEKIDPEITKMDDKIVVKFAKKK